MRSGNPGRGRDVPSATILLLLAVLAVSIAGGLVAAVPANGSATTAVQSTTPHAPSATPQALHDAATAPAAADPPMVTLQDQPDADATVTRIALAANGSATWTIEVRTRLTSGDDVTEYEGFQERFRSNRTRYREDFEDRMSGVVASANGSIDRPMAAAAFQASTRIEEAPQRWGVVTYSFRWEGFAATDGDSVVVGDVFGGDFFIEENSVLEIVAPEGHALETVEPSPDDRSGASVVWEGPATFGDGLPRVVASTDVEADAVSPWWIGAGIAVLAVLVAIAVAWRRGIFGGQTADAASGTGPVDDEARTDSASLAEQKPLTDEGRVREVLAANGGRCKQSLIVEELDWSKSKTSRVLSRMAEEDRIEKLRIGRENVIELADEEQSLPADSEE